MRSAAACRRRRRRRDPCLAASRPKRVPAALHGIPLLLEAFQGGLVGICARTWGLLERICAALCVSVPECGMCAPVYRARAGRFRGDGGCRGAPGRTPTQFATSPREPIARAGAARPRAPVDREGEVGHVDAAIVRRRYGAPSCPAGWRGLWRRCSSSGSWRTARRSAESRWPSHGTPRPPRRRSHDPSGHVGTGNRPR